MEFYNEKLLPRGLPELMCQVAPQDHSLNVKVIAYPRKQRRGILGSVGFDTLAECWEIRLYPTIIGFFCPAPNIGVSGTYSYKLWAAFLDTSLHEIGHIATWPDRANVPVYADANGHARYPSYKYHHYVEGLATEWATRTAHRILQADPRMGQPEGALGGYPGALAYQRRGGGRRWGNEVDYGRISEWRGMRCGGQVPIGHVVSQFYYTLPGEPGGLEHDDLMKVRAIVRRAVHRGARELGIARHFTNRRGWRYLMFNVGEALRVLAWLETHKEEVTATTLAAVPAMRRHSEDSV